MAVKDQEELNQMRLSDRILFALELALEQKDAIVAGLLSNVLEVAMTRNAGGQQFVERRHYSDRVNDALNKAGKLQNK